VLVLLRQTTGGEQRRGASDNNLSGKHAVLDYRRVSGYRGNSSNVYVLRFRLPSAPASTAMLVLYSNENSTTSAGDWLKSL
jgi:hypothetical protein